MLKMKTEVRIVGPDGSGAPAPYRVSGERRCRTWLAGHLRRSAQEPSLVMLFRAGPQGYPPLGGPRDGAQSGECRLRDLAQALPEEQAPGRSGAMAEAASTYRSALDEMRRRELTKPQPTDAVWRLLGAGFALEQFRRDLDDLILYRRARMFIRYVSRWGQDVMRLSERVTGNAR